MLGGKRGEDMREIWSRAALTGAILYLALQFVPSSIDGQARALAAAALAGLATIVSARVIRRA
jgi:hypothetical protein